MDAKIDFIESFKVVDLKEDDIIVLKPNTVMSDRQYELLCRRVKEVIPERLKGKVKIIVTESIDIGVMRSKIEDAN